MLTKPEYDALYPFRSIVKQAPLSEMDEHLHSMKCIAPSSHKTDGVQFYLDDYKITPLGEKMLQEFEEAAKKDAKVEKQQRYDNFINGANLLVAFLAFILGILAEEKFGIMEFIKTLFS